MRKLRTASTADRDIVESALWFEQQQPGFGSQFLAALDTTLEDIRRRPLSCPTFIVPGRNLKVPLRWLALGRFPRIAIFEVTNDEIVVYGVLHPHRDLESLLVARIDQN